ncbi:MAG: hypothetical protein BHV96_03185 [Clostridium sp. CAG:354_28_25]|nr:MAG: hypothetical protein BHV96_03185 [Clostridium sp. CAG:354_28_25]
MVQNKKLTVKSDIFKEIMSIYSLSIEEINKIIKEMEVKYKELNLIDHVKCRIKSPKSIVNKMKKKKYNLTYKEMINKVNDIAGIRIICPFQENVYIVRELLLENPNIRILNEKDYIQFPKKSGYSSLHLIVEVPVKTDMGKIYVKAEIQIRTMAMDFWASLEHELKYKNNNVTKAASKRLLKAAKVMKKLDYEMSVLAKEVR